MCLIESLLFFEYFGLASPKSLVVGISWNYMGKREKLELGLKRGVIMGVGTEVSNTIRVLHTHVAKGKIRTDLAIAKGYHVWILCTSDQGFFIGFGRC